jgi:MtrB/PioB family decaheme-associated outer membrane protein
MNYKNPNIFPRHPRKVLVLAIAMAFAIPAVAADEDEEIRRLIKPESVISLGMGHVSGDNQRFGMYNGLNQAGYVGLIDFSVVRRDDETGTWYRALGRNLGLDNREFGLEVERQGSWGASFNYDEITRHSPYTVYSNNQGIDSTRQTIPTPRNATTPLAPGATPYSLKTERHKATFGLNASLMSNLEFRLVFQNEKKEGQRLYGRGTTPSVQEFLAEPIDFTTKQFDAVLDYTGESLQLSGGYYGSFFNNSNSVLKVAGGNTALSTSPFSSSGAGVAFDNMSLPPDNHAHQFHLTGGYQFDKLTKLNFKAAKSIAVQEDNFIPVQFYNTTNTGASANTSGRSDLGGRVDTTLFKLGISSRPIKNLSILGDIRYENRNDKTEVARYITGQRGTPPASATNPILLPLASTSSTDGYNEPRSLTNKSAKLEASYLLPEGFRLTGGYDYDQKERTTNGVRVVGYREKTEENTYRLEVKRTMAESLTGSFAYLHSDREGSDYKNLVTLNGTNNYPSYTALNCGARVTTGLSVTRCGLIQPIYMADRERDRIRLLVDWSPLDQLSAQFSLEGSNDNYGPGRGTPDIGVRQGDSRLYSVDLAYTLSEKLKFTGWYSRTGTSIDQSTISNPGAGNTAAVLWSSSQRNTVDTFGLGLRTKLPMNIDLGADYVFANDKTRYGMSRDAYAPFTLAAIPANSPGNLPDIKYRQNTVRIFGAYNFDKDTKFRLDYIFDNRRISDWTWSGYQYSDGTRVSPNAEDTVHFVGVSVSYAFR